MTNMQIKEPDKGGSDKRIAVISIAGTIVIAALGLAGYYIPGLQLMGSIRLDYIPMAPSTAVSFILLGAIALLAASKVRQASSRASIVIASLIATFGFLKVAEYFAGTGISFEELIIRPAEKLVEVPVGIMSPYTGALFFIAGLAALAHLRTYSEKERTGFFKNTAGILSLTVLVASFTFILSYVLGKPFLYDMGTLVPVAFTTAIAFFLLSLGQIIANGKDRFPLAPLSGYSVSARLMRHFLPATVLIILCSIIIEHVIERFCGTPAHSLRYSVGLVTFAVIVIAVMGRSLGAAIDRIDAHRKKAEEELVKEDNELKLILNSSPIIIFYKDKEGRLLRANKTFAESLGLPEEKITGKTVFDLYPVNIAQSMTNDDRQVMESGESKLGIIEQHEGKRGRRWLQTDKIPIFDIDGKVTGLIGFAQDITERKRAEDELTEFKLISDNSVDAHFLADRDAKFEYVNKAACKMFGYSEEELLVRGIPDVGGMDLKKYQELFDLIQRETVLPFEKTGKKKNGLVFPVEVSVTGYKIDEKRYMFAAVRNITERKNAEKELSRYRNMLEEIIEEKTEELKKTYNDIESAKRLSDIGALAATIAHELRNPLGVIKTAAYNIKRKTSDGSLDSHLANIDKKIAESDQIIKNLLSYSRIKVPHYETVSILDILRACTDYCRSKYEKWNVKVDTSSNCAPEYTIEVDSLHLNELFSNILDNSYQAFPDKHGIIEVNIDCHKEKGAVIIVFRDNGIGIEEKDMPNISKPFFTTKARGIGLGLTVCRQIVNLHEGELDIESAKGEGTTVTVRLPVRRPA